eukprot:scaffold208457_cov28-Tisochrysis_lutea.AAC.1
MCTHVLPYTTLNPTIASLGEESGACACADKHTYNSSSHLCTCSPSAAIHTDPTIASQNETRTSPNAVSSSLMLNGFAQ